MLNTNKESCRELINLLCAWGVKDAVISPGSRNAPLIVAAKRDGRIRVNMIVDERSAGFYALGLSVTSKHPVALICTSGSAVLNYGPALAEAYYRGVPLIAISADRPLARINQNESQTINQRDVLANVVKASYDIDGDNGAALRSFRNRLFNEAISTAVNCPQGPVHINLHLSEPLGNLVEVTESNQGKTVFLQSGANSLTQNAFDKLADELRGKRIMVVCGYEFNAHRLENALNEFSETHNAVVLEEIQGGLRIHNAICHIDSCLSAISEENVTRYAPDVVISFGGPLVTRMLAQYIKKWKPMEHWHISQSDKLIDQFECLTKHICCGVSEFFKEMAERQRGASQYAFKNAWLTLQQTAHCATSEYLSACRWSDFYAIGKLMDMIPSDWNVQLGNGTVVRYAQLFDYSHITNVECNRGVSGIDGSTSTAIGAHVGVNGVTLLISGDMSAQYDIGALALSQITPKFKMVIICNGGGGIFRFINSTSALQECEECFAIDPNMNWHAIATAFGFAYFEQKGKNDFEQTFETFANEQAKPALLNIITPANESTQILKNYFSNIKSLEQCKQEHGKQ